MTVIVASRVIAGSRGEDRACDLKTDRGDLIVVADGAGGSGGGAFAAEFVVEGVREFTGDDFVALLEDIDRRLFEEGDGAESTAVVLLITDGSLKGASVGDSSAWLVDDTVLDITSAQSRKPLVGSGRARPVSFDVPRRGVLVVGTDGLFKYAPRGRIMAGTQLANADNVADALVAAARLPSGGLQDDIAVVVAI